MTSLQEGVGSSCPDCSSSRTSMISSVGKAFVQPPAGRSFLQAAYGIFECAHCGLLFRSPSLSDSELGDYYASLPGDHWEYAGFNPPERCISHILSELPEQTRVLDFGCSSGRLLAPWTARHFCHGFEINARAAEVAGSRGIAMMTEEELWGRGADAFDIIILVDVFEHLRKPSTLLTKLWKLLAPGGRLIVSTGDGNHWACRLDPAQFWYFRNLEHLCMMTRSFAEHLATSLGGRIESWINVSHYDLPLSTRLRLHAAHTAYWLMRAVPDWLRVIAAEIPGVQKAVRWSNAPHYACCKDHVVCVVLK